MNPKRTASSRANVDVLLPKARCFIPKTAASIPGTFLARRIMRFTQLPLLSTVRPMLPSLLRAYALRRAGLPHG